MVKEIRSECIMVEMCDCWLADLVAIPNYEMTILEVHKILD